MRKELRALLNKINAKKEDVRDLVAKGNLEEAKAVKEELRDLQEQFNLLADLEDDAEEKAEENARKGKGRIASGADDAKRQVEAFANAMKAAGKKKHVSQEDAEILDAMSEGSDEDGGLTVPDDARTQIKELRRGEDALEELVNVEHVNTDKGSRVIEKAADQTPFDNVEEDAEFPEAYTPKFESIKYEIHKKGGIIKITRELLQDSAENIMAYIQRWIGKKGKATRNFMIVKKINEICGGLEIPIGGIDDLKDIFNVMLDPAIAEGGVVLTNQSGFNFLDKLKDERGDYILQRDPTQPTKKLLFGIYPIRRVSNKTLPNVKGKAPIVCGDLKEAITLFDRELLTVDITDLAAGAWERDQTSIKARERLDIQAVDINAIVMGLADVGLSKGDSNNDGVKDDRNGDGEYSEKELNRLSRENILALAEENGYTMTKTAEDKKEEVIADFLAQQEVAKQKQ